MALELRKLWDFFDPARSEQNFRRALHTATPDETLLLQTQIARTYSLRRRYGDAHAVLDAIENRVSRSGPEAKVRFWLERGRALRSAGVANEAQPFFVQASALAQQTRLDELAIDALHMQALIEPNPVSQIRINQNALRIAQESAVPAARNWDAALLNNLGMNLHGEGRLDEALLSFEQALEARQRIFVEEPTPTRERDLLTARWMIAWTLRGLKRHQEALALLASLEGEFSRMNQEDGYVFEEMAENLLAEGAPDRARPYFARAFNVLNRDQSSNRIDSVRLKRLRALGRVAGPAPQVEEQERV